MLNINIDKLKKLENTTNEAYKRLRTNIQFCGDDVKFRVFAQTIDADNNVISTKKYVI